MAARKTNSFLFNRILSNFPKDMTMAFAYGSGVFQQIGNKDKNNMIDFVFVVDKPKHWHHMNLQRNPDHYSALRHLGAERIVKIQEMGAGVYYNTLVRCEDKLNEVLASAVYLVDFYGTGVAFDKLLSTNLFNLQLIKYGVVSQSTLNHDLVHWDTLYLSGRLHKPVHIIKRSSSDRLYNAIRRNLQSALYASLLQLPESFTEEELFTKIAGLSYGGDFRMIFGEDKNKVGNIVQANLDGFKTYYKDMLNTTEHIYWNPLTRTIEQDRSPSCMYSHLNCLPRNLQLHIARLAGSATHDVGEVLTRIAREKQCTEFVARAARNIVRSSSIPQSVKGILTAGLAKTTNYSLQKLGKMWRGGLLPR